MGGRGAVREPVRARPGEADAAWNYELALRRLEQQKKQQQQQKQGGQPPPKKDDFEKKAKMSRDKAEQLLQAIAVAYEWLLSYIMNLEGYQDLYFGPDRDTVRKQVTALNKARVIEARGKRVNPNLADSYLLAAEVYSVTKQYSKCADEYQLAIKLRPQGADLYVKMARCYRQGGSPDVAESMLNIAATQESGLPEIYKEQGLSLIHI